MSRMHWSHRYIGIPYRDKGRTGRGLDCWGLVRLVYADLLGIELPSYDDSYVSAGGDLSERQQIAAIVAGAQAGGDWIEVGKPDEFDILVFRIGRHDSHVAIWAGQRRMLHVEETGDSVRLELASQWLPRLAGIHRHRQAAELVP